MALITLTGELTVPENIFFPASKSNRLAERLEGIRETALTTIPWFEEVKQRVPVK